MYERMFLNQKSYLLLQIFLNRNIVATDNLCRILDSDSFCVLSDVETTGSSSEFYDKFTIRYHISLILKGMWDSPVHRQAIVNESRLLTCMNILGILSVIVVEPSVSFPGSELNIFTVDIVLKIEDCLVLGEGGGSRICRVCLILS